MERVAEAVASGMGTVAFIVIATVLILVWVFANGAAHCISATVTNIGKGQQFDPEPWILLNLVFSAVRFFTGALVNHRLEGANEDGQSERGGGGEAPR